MSNNMDLSNNHMDRESCLVQQFYEVSSTGEMADPTAQK